jgi:hypothetical protein
MLPIPGREAGGQPDQQVLDRDGAVVAADEHLRVVGVVHEGGHVLAFLAGAEEAGDGGLAVGAADPPVGGAELELRGLWRALDDVQGGEEGGDVDAVAGDAFGGGRWSVASSRGTRWSSR